jgi:hypothetical protein
LPIYISVLLSVSVAGEKIMLLLLQQLANLDKILTESDIVYPFIDDMLLWLPRDYDMFIISTIH